MYAGNQFIEPPDGRRQSNNHSISFEFNMADLLVSSVHDMKNSVSLLIRSLDNALALDEITELSAHAELIQMNREAKRINGGLIQLLMLYKLGHKIYPFDPQMVCLEHFLQVTTVQYAELLKFQGINLDIHVDPGLYWYFDEDLISGVIVNALNNALRYARNHIRIIAEENEGGLMIRVEDDGIGYPADILRKNDDLMHGGDSRGGAAGLGLYFAARAANAHHNQGRHGALQLENGGSLKGACLILHLP